MSSRYRPASPPYSRRYVPPGRSSTGTVTDSTYDQGYYGRDRHDSYVSPRTSGEGVIPVSTETYRNGSLVSSSRRPPEAYGEPRRASAIDPSLRRAAPPSSFEPPSNRHEPAVIHQSNDRSLTTSGRRDDLYDRGDYYVTPASSTGRREHRKTPSTEDSNRSSLALRPRGEPYDRTPAKRESLDRDGARDGNRRGYHLTGPAAGSRTSAPTDDDPGYEYTSPREVFENTPPTTRWRPRRTSIDVPNRDRPPSMDQGYAPPRPLAREAGPPPTTRALDKIGGAVSRHESIRDPVRSPPRARERNSYQEYEDANYGVQPRMPRPRPDSAIYDETPEPYSPTRGGADDRRDSLRPSRRWEDVDVVNRGFGIRAPSADPPYDDEEAYARGGYAQDFPPRRTQEPGPPREERRREFDRQEFDRNAESGRELPRDREKEEREMGRRRERDLTHEKDRDTEYSDEPRRLARDRDYDRDIDVDKRTPESRRARDRYHDQEPEVTSKDGRKADQEATSATASAAVAGAAAVAAGEAVDRRRSKEDSTPSPEPHAQEDNSLDSDRRDNGASGDIDADDAITHHRNYVTKDEKREKENAERSAAASTKIDPDEEYRLRVQQEMNRFKQTKSEPGNGDGAELQPRTTAESAELETSRVNSRSEGREEEEGGDGRNGERERPTDESRSLELRSKTEDSVFDETFSEEPGEMSDERDSRVRIVEPPRERERPKSILRKPTEKFPEDPNPVREGVTLHKDARLPDGVPENAKWTKISRKMVNPQALEEAEERYEERSDCVVVLRPLSREQIQKLADRTQEIRDEREQEPKKKHSHRHHHHHHRSRDDDED